MMDFLRLPSPVVHNILSFLDAEDCLNYLLVVAPDNLTAFSLPRFHLASRFHADLPMAEALLRLARRSRYVSIRAPVLALQPSAFVRAVSHFSQVRHLDMRGVRLSTAHLSRLFPVLARVETLKYCVVQEGRALASRLDSVEAPYASLRCLHVAFDCEAWKYGNCSWLLPPGIEGKLGLRVLSLEALNPDFDDFGVLRQLVKSVECEGVEEVRMRVRLGDFLFVLCSALRAFPNLRLVEMTADFQRQCDIQGINETIAHGVMRHLNAERRPGADKEIVLKQARAEVRRKASAQPLPTYDDKINYLFWLGNALRFSLSFDSAVGQWSVRKADPHLRRFEMNRHSLPLVAQIRGVSLADVRCLSLCLDELDGFEATEVAGELQPTTLRLMLRRPLVKEERERAMARAMTLLRSFSRVGQLFVYGLNFLSYDDLCRVFEPFFPTLTDLHLFHSQFYAWKPNSSIVRLPAAVQRLSRLRTLTIACAETCWDTLVIDPDRLCPVLADLQDFRRLLLFCPNLSLLKQRENALHLLMRARPSLHEMTIVVPGLSTSTSHLMVKRLRNTAAETNYAYAKKMVFRVVNQLREMEENRPLSDFLAFDFS